MLQVSVLPRLICMGIISYRCQYMILFPNLVVPNTKTDFRIDANGDVYVTGVLDRETVSSYYLVVKVVVFIRISL